MPLNIADLKALFFGGGADAEYEFYDDANDAGVTAEHLLGLALNAAPVFNARVSDYWSYPTSHGTSALAAGTVTYTPFYAPYDVTLDRIGAEVTTAAASTTVTLGVYASGTTPFTPGNLLLDAGTIDGNSQTAQEITIDLDLTGGHVYWLAGMSAGGTPTVRTVSGSAGAPSWSGRQSSLSNALGSGFPRQSLSQTGVVGDELPASATPTTIMGGAHLVAVRRGA
jgi:hypothetical protein